MSNKNRRKYKNLLAINSSRNNNNSNNNNNNNSSSSSNNNNNRTRAAAATETETRDKGVAAQQQQVNNCSFPNNSNSILLHNLIIPSWCSSMFLTTIAQVSPLEFSLS